MDKDAQAEKERTWQAFLELPYRSRSEYKALATGFDAGYACASERLTAVEDELKRLKAWCFDTYSPRSEGGRE